ncbi:hypothetical protein CEXT_731911 [Caerostris extrusa]|uniref:Uncharacterized protein n=1 Tax=Caerostris extrusa TaxID=172846 RepID=A0AAV4QFB3_CAEEX|nr:hypothetical protein CEXT_731911 [Caerostris extrusa]
MDSSSQNPSKVVQVRVISQRNPCPHHDASTLECVIGNPKFQQRHLVVGRRNQNCLCLLQRFSRGFHQLAEVWGLPRRNEPVSPIQKVQVSKGQKTYFTFQNFCISNIR